MQNRNTRTSLQDRLNEVGNQFENTFETTPAAPAVSARPEYRVPPILPPQTLQRSALGTFAKSASATLNAAVAAGMAWLVFTTPVKQAAVGTIGATPATAITSKAPAPLGISPVQAAEIPAKTTAPTQRVAHKQFSPPLGKSTMVEEGTAAFQNLDTLDASCQNLLANGFFKAFSKTPTQTMVREIACPVAEQIAAIARQNPQDTAKLTEVAVAALADATITTQEIYDILTQVRALGIQLPQETIDRATALKAEAEKKSWTRPTFTAEDYAIFGQVLVK